MFITFEGPEGSGKTTQIRALAQALEERGVDVVATREPGGTPLGDCLREILLHDQENLSATTEALLMTAARAEHVKDVIVPALQSGKVVLCDRFADSTLAYQGAGRGLELSQLMCLQRMALGEVWPNLTLLLDLDVKVGLRRRAGDQDMNRLDREPLEFHERIAAWYRQQATLEPERWEVIDAAQTPTEVQAAVLKVVLRRMAISNMALVDEG